eukprot:COSAG01_NODE_32640_length_578_cov_0.630480_1_plen_165_part_10
MLGASAADKRVLRCASDSGHYSHMPVVWATAHVTQFAQPGWRYLNTGFGSGLLRHGGYFTTMVSPDLKKFSTHVVKISFDHAACTRPCLPSTLKGVEDETVTFKLTPQPNVTMPTRLACWRSNFELRAPILFTQQPDVIVAADGSFTLHVTAGDYFTVSTVRTAR